MTEDQVKERGPHVEEGILFVPDLDNEEWRALLTAAGFLPLHDMWVNYQGQQPNAELVKWRDLYDRYAPGVRVIGPGEDVTRSLGRAESALPLGRPYGSSRLWKV